jgi:hypothetical protein
MDALGGLNRRLLGLEGGSARVEALPRCLILLLLCAQCRGSFRSLGSHLGTRSRARSPPRNMGGSAWFDVLDRILGSSHGLGWWMSHALWGCECKSGEELLGLNILVVNLLDLRACLSPLLAS